LTGARETRQRWKNSCRWSTTNCAGWRTITCGAKPSAIPSNPPHLVDHARQRQAAKRGGSEQERLSITSAETILKQPAVDLLALNEALDDLAQLDPQQGRIVELKFFAGLSIEETAEVLGISHATVERDWKMARAWLRRQLE
jgi:RNA polymerase sigma factor (TIGR02999 family)